MSPHHYKCGEVSCPLGGTHTNLLPLLHRLRIAYPSAPPKSGEASFLAGSAYAYLQLPLLSVYTSVSPKCSEAP